MEPPFCSAKGKRKCFRRKPLVKKKKEKESDLVVRKFSLGANDVRGDLGAKVLVQLIAKVHSAREKELVLLWPLLGRRSLKDLLS